jgi:molecular chaperone GrpE
LDVVFTLNSTDPQEPGQDQPGYESGGTETGPGETADASVHAADETDTPEAASEAAEPAADADTPESANGSGPRAEPAPVLMAEISVAVRELADSSQRYHARAEQREAVIDHLRDEVERLRRGERRGVLRPVLTDMCRLRDDLLNQAATLPTEFDAAKATALLRSYAETIEITLESNGVITYTPDNGDSFNPRLHRRISGAPTAEPALAGHIAAIRRDGYLDIETNSPIAPAEVTVYAVAKGEQEQ